MNRVLIADDFKLLRQGLATTINALPGFTVTAEAADGNAAYAAVENRDIDVAIIDISMPPGESGLITLKRIHDYYPDVKTMVMSMHEEAEFITQALANGALAYVLKSSDETELTKALNHIVANHVYIDNNITMTSSDLQSLAKQQADKRYADLDAVHLSRREREILPLVGLGFSNQEIADKLFVTRKTVEAHKTSLMKKLNMTSRRELVHFALQHHLIDF
ncbi:response regulator [Lacticaseibacillus baoqingensis]|uniref:Response regulator n=1 Tax=Lacticaseibacillus baoqingensis TaxID=2486013 RepID=A0ABW4E7L6_9LACO|nr:response regulator transcription factor [Lacticaseibacillus baoqingensis]